MTTPKQVQELIEASGGKVDTMGVLPDGQGFAVGVFPLPADHWLYAEHENVPPAQSRDLSFIRADIVASARYAIRDATHNGKITDFDPDALVQQMVVGLLGRPSTPLDAADLPRTSTLLKDWRPADALDETPLDTAEMERLRAKAWMNTAAEYRRVIEQRMHTGSVRLPPRGIPLLCPACGDEYLHHDVVTVRSRPKEDGPGTQTVIMEDGSLSQCFLPADWEHWQGRRAELVIEVWCEACNQRSEVLVVQHKGNTLLSSRELGPHQEGP